MLAQNYNEPALYMANRWVHFASPQQTTVGHQLHNRSFTKTSADDEWFVLVMKKNYAGISLYS